MRITKLDFGSLLTYTPRGQSADMQDSREFMIALKMERFVEDQKRKTVHQILLAPLCKYVYC